MKISPNHRFARARIIALVGVAAVLSTMTVGISNAHAAENDADVCYSPATKATNFSSPLSDKTVFECGHNKKGTLVDFARRGYKIVNLSPVMAKQPGHSHERLVIAK